MYQYGQRAPNCISRKLSTLILKTHIQEISPFFRPIQERQRLQFCLLHCLNNLFQSQRFTASDLNTIADALSSPHGQPLLFHPYRSIFRTGNYDVNVLEVCLERQGYQLHWLDQRDLDFQGINYHSDELLGIIINIPGGGAGFLNTLLFKGRHWFSIKCINGSWLNLDSKLKQPEQIGCGDRSSSEVASCVDLDELKSFLKRQVENGGVILYATRKNVT